MHILVTNDDGYNAPGLLVLSDALRNQHHRVTIVAPREDKSGCGMGISLRKNVEVEEKSPGYFIVDGTPGDCVYIGLHNLISEPVDLVISGINNGTNLADDIFYSGTFAGAMEARRMTMPSIALSVTERSVNHYETAAYIAVQMSNALPHLDYRSLIAVLNVNVPDVAVADLRGLKATILGDREPPLKPIERARSGNKAMYQAGPVGDFRRSKRSKTQDFEAIEQGFASITPLSARLDDSGFVDDVQTWLDTI